MIKSPIVNKLLEESLPFRNYVIASFVINLFLVVSVIICQRFLPPQVPLYYGMAEGEGQLASSLALTIPNLAALAISTLNLIISRLVEDDFLKKTLVLIGLAATFLATITVVKIAFLVGSF